MLPTPRLKENPQHTAWYPKDENNFPVLMTLHNTTFKCFSSNFTNPITERIGLYPQAGLRHTRMTSSIATVNRVAIQVIIIGFNTNPLLSRVGKAHSFFGSLVPVWLLIQNIVIDQFTLWRSYPQGQEHSLSKQECRLTKSVQMQTQI